MGKGILNRRREERIPADGHISLCFDDPLPSVIEGRLIDVSSCGFRAAHQHPTLALGQEVRFRHDGAQGRARVAWNRVEAGSVETGFFVVCTNL